MLFGKDVNRAVQQSLETGKVLVVYCKGDDDVWLNKWFDHGADLSHKGVFLEVVKGTGEFDNFVQIFPGVVVPSVRLIKQGQSVLVIQGDDTGHEVSHWKKLMIGLGVATAGKRSDNSEKKKFDKSEREKIVEKTTAAYQKEYQKQLQQSEEERLRILRLVRADKAERLARRHSEDNQDVPLTEVRDNILDKSRFKTDKCVLMFRLTDSKTLTHTFDSSMCLNDVRKWVDNNRTDGAGPYSFHRNIPRVTFTESDELKSLEDLDLAPRSVLLLKALDSGNRHLNVADEQDAGIINKMFTGFSQWWGGSNSASPATEEQLLHHGEPQQAQPRAVSNNVNQSAASSTYSTPIIAPHVSRLAKDPSEMNLASRSESPNIVKFVNRDDQEDDPEEKNTYNGNNIKLEKRDKEL